ncbi:hypothetical protein HDU99_010077, partial [Rhizoclosmatium hyalinum]
ILERHPYTTQSFIPMGLAASDISTAYIVIVAPYDPVFDKPDVSRVRAFLARGDQGVTYNVGAWHSPMVVVGESSVLFSVIQWVNGVAKDDCTECEVLDEEVSVQIPPSLRGKNAKL